MIRIMVERKEIGTGKPVRPEIRWFCLGTPPGSRPDVLLSMVSRLERFEEDNPEDKYWIVVNGMILSREQIPYDFSDGYEWATRLLEKFARTAAERRASGRQERADLASGINKALKFGL